MRRSEEKTKVCGGGGGALVLTELDTLHQLLTGLSQHVFRRSQLM